MVQAITKLLPLVAKYGGRALTAYFVGDAVVKTSQNIEEVFAGTIVSPAVLALPDGERERIMSNVNKSRSNAVIVALSVAVGLNVLLNMRK